MNPAPKTEPGGAALSSYIQVEAQADGIDEVLSAVTHAQAPFNTSALDFSKETLLESILLSFHKIAVLCTENEPYINLRLHLLEDIALL